MNNITTKQKNIIKRLAAGKIRTGDVVKAAYVIYSPKQTYDIYVNVEVKNLELYAVGINDVDDINDRKIYKFKKPLVLDYDEQPYYLLVIGYANRCKLVNTQCVEYYIADNAYTKTRKFKITDVLAEDENL